ncbi:DUF6292 family protein [Saccharothrix saharensis]|uniref:DUF6292 family protein n=1 Tax=Saccharothrix saharensis TaxID=571190 RepID=UPI003699842D
MVAHTCRAFGPRLCNSTRRQPLGFPKREVALLWDERSGWAGGGGDVQRRAPDRPGVVRHGSRPRPQAVGWSRTCVRNSSSTRRRDQAGPAAFHRGSGFEFLRRARLTSDQRRAAHLYFVRRPRPGAELVVATGERATR